MVMSPHYDGDTHVFLIEEKGTTYNVWHEGKHIGVYASLQTNLNAWAWGKGYRGRVVITRRATPTKQDYIFKLTVPPTLTPRFAAAETGPTLVS